MDATASFFPQNWKKDGSVIGLDQNNSVVGLDKINPFTSVSVYVSVLSNISHIIKTPQFLIDFWYRLFDQFSHKVYSLYLKHCLRNCFLDCIPIFSHPQAKYQKEILCFLLTILNLRISRKLNSKNFSIKIDQGRLSLINSAIG